jgi:predicted MPP superfamily phosphohydrolase
MFNSVMSNLNKLLVFGVLGLFFLIFDLYAWQAFKTLSREWSAKSKSILFYSYWTLSILFIVMIILRPYIQLEKLNSSFLSLFQVFGVILLISKVFVVIPLLFEDVYRVFEGVIGFFRKTNGTDSFMAERRKFISLTGLTVGALPLMGMTWGLIRGAHNYKIRKLKLDFADLPKAFDGLKIIQLSDIHSGSFWDRSAVERGIRMVNELKPDLVFFTGDLVNNTADEMDEWKELFGSIQSKYGIYSVLGNHDYGDYVYWANPQEKESNLQKLMNVHAEMGWKLLNNTSALIEKGEEKIAVVGVENWSAKGNFPKYGKLQDALETCNDCNFKILLSHDPSHWKAEVLKSNKRIHLTLSGHTHGFQFGIETHGWKWSPVKYMYPEWAGLYAQKDSYLYVNRGFGYIGYPGRLGINPEITEITLRKS